MRNVVIVFSTLIAGLAAGQGTVGAPPTDITPAPLVSVVVDGDAVDFADQEPIMQYGRVLVPLRGVFEKMGATVSYDPSNRKITAVRDNKRVELWARKAVARVNGIETVLDQSAIIVGGRTMIPLRFISESLGAAVHWDGATRTVTIT